MHLNFPAIAKQSFDKLKDSSIFFKITSNLLERLRFIKTPFIRARIVNRAVDKEINELFKDPLVASSVKCKKGCTACCHTHVSVTQDEAELLLKRINDDTPIDSFRLHLQAQAFNDSKLWYQLQYQERACIFLGNSGECRVYDDRPAVCRTNFVVSEPHQCLTIDGKEKFVRILKTDKADMAVMAGYIHSGENGTLPFMIYKAMQKNDRKYGGAPLVLPPYKNLPSV